MKDIAKKVDVFDGGIPMVKGHTKIVLTDVRTGEEKVIEHDNTFQSDVIAAQLRSMGAYANSPWNNETWRGRRLWRNLCGGILLFRDTIDVSGGDVPYMPAGNKMIANGAYGVSNNGNPTELGSYNMVESSTGGNVSLTFVYDWGTAQGNGTINCVCLTSEVGGYIGYGNDSGSSVGKKSLIENQNAVSDTNGIPYGNAIYSFSRDANAKTITVTKRKKAITQASLFDTQGTETVTLSYASTLIGDKIDAFYDSNGKFVLLPWTYQSWNDTVSVSGSFKYLIYDATSDTLTEKTITNSTSNTLRVGNFSSSACAVACGKVIIPKNVSTTSSGLPLALFDIATGNVDLVSSGVNVDSWVCAAIAPNLIGFTDNDGWLKIYDTNTKTLRITNGAGLTTGNGGQRIHNDNLNAFFTGVHNGFAVYKNPLYLATVNNLSSAVVKTNTQTMKVIYTLTEA